MPAQPPRDGSGLSVSGEMLQVGRWRDFTHLLKSPTSVQFCKKFLRAGHLVVLKENVGGSLATRWRMLIFNVRTCHRQTQQGFQTF